MKQLVATPATDRLGWILDGLNAEAGWGADAGEVLAPEFAAIVSAERFTGLMRQWAADFAPVAVTGVEAGEDKATARVRVRDGSVRVVTCMVERRPPHRITLARIMRLTPDFLAPRLPLDFTGCPLPEGVGGPSSDSRLIVFSGVPGTGKSTLADAAGRELGIPAFAADWLLGALTPFGGYHGDRLLETGAELLTTLAYRQLLLGQSAILDYPAEEPATRTRWRTLAEAAGARFLVVLCTCSDPDVHRARLERRERGIPGWHQGGNWANVQRRLAQFPPWTSEWTSDMLTVDATRPLAENLTAVLEYAAG